ncbi:MAG: toll/interleukin-1 receptor domain-containing protein [Gammaproteobacteria bacterium]|nr:toll/interleukin-1 receptor domain-containing protein [Gammaproteobacteria bacterium]
MKDFFISYNKADRRWAEWIGWELEEAGYSTVIQAWDFKPGGNFVLEMDKAIQAAQCWAGENPLKLSLAIDPAFVPLFDWTKMQYCVLIEQIDLVSP